MIPKKSQFSSSEGRALLGRANAAITKESVARAEDPWTSGGAKNNEPYRDPMPSVKVKYK